MRNRSLRHQAREHHADYHKPGEDAGLWRCKIPSALRPKLHGGPRRHHGGDTCLYVAEVLLEKFPDERADIFSLGVVLYEMVSGHHPFLAGSFVATSDRIRHETPTPIHIFNSKVPEELEKLISKALAKEPGQRHASARELLQDLRVVQASVTPLKLSRVLPRRAKRPRKRWLAAGIVVAAVAAAVSGIYSWHHRSPILTH